KAVFDDPNVGTAKPVSVSGIHIAGSDAPNYYINPAATTTADITPLATVSSPVILSAPTAQYSDDVTFEASISPGVLGGQASAPATTVTFYVGTQAIGTAPLVPSPLQFIGAPVIGTLKAPLLETLPTGQLAPG